MSSPVQRHPLVVGLALAVLAWSGAGRAESVEPLPTLNVDLKETSVSGLSSGGFMAV
jgi:poly(3-hydroxybutyrate) depolymerase